jgi:hypothetical protein
LFASAWAILIERLFWLPDGSIRLDLYIAAIAAIAAFAGGWCARIYGYRDHGWLGGAFAAPLFGIMLAALPLVIVLVAAPGFFLTGLATGVDIGVRLIPYSLAGTAAFLGLLQFMRYVHRR